jgi:hypothetical protein
MHACLPTLMRSALTLAAAAACALALQGCADVPTRNAVGALGTLVAAHVPTAQISQVYYLGVFDPRDQIPPTIYRVRVMGQSSALNTSTQFASGWVHADLLDTLSSSKDFDSTVKDLGGSKAGADAGSSDKSSLTGRRLIMFGPEGFREAPKKHRLVVVMGANPAGFFGAIDNALGSVAEVTQGGTVGPDITRALFAELSRTRAEARRLDDLASGLSADDSKGSK